MEKQNNRLREACSELRETIANNKIHLDNLQEEIGESKMFDSRINRLQIEKADPIAAHEMRKHSLAYLQGGLKASDCQPNFVLKNKDMLISLARIWQSRSKVEIQELLVEEKLTQTLFKEEKERIMTCLNENKQLLEVHLKEKRSLENKQEELEAQRISELEEKLAIVKRVYADMKLHLKNTIDKFFPDPKVPGYTGMYSLLNELTQRLQERERDAYIEVKNTIWPYYLETLENHGIIERHPTDRNKVRIIDFSDGRLGS